MLVILRHYAYRHTSISEEFFIYTSTPWCNAVAVSLAMHTTVPLYYACTHNHALLRDSVFLHAADYEVVKLQQDICREFPCTGLSICDATRPPGKLCQQAQLATFLATVNTFL